MDGENTNMSNSESKQHASPLVFVIPGVVTGTILIICIIVTLCVCARYRGWCPRIFQPPRTRQPQKQEIERIKNKIIEQYRRRKRKSRKNDVIPDVIDSTLICAICLDGYVSTISKRHRMLAQLTQCGHHFHFNCIFQWLDRNPSCPVCRTPVVLSDEKIKAIGLQDVCCLDKPLDLMPSISDQEVMIMTPTAEPSTFIPSSGTPSPRLMAAYLLPSNQDSSPSVPSVGSGSTFSTMSSVKSSNTLDRCRVNTMPNPNSSEPQPSTSTNAPLQTLDVTNLPTLTVPPPMVTSEITPPPKIIIPRTDSQIAVNVEINALAFYNDCSSSESSESDVGSSRHSTSSSSSYDSAHDMWLPDNSSSIIRPISDASFDNCGSMTNIVSGVSRDVGAQGLDNPAFEEDIDTVPHRPINVPKVHIRNRTLAANCDTKIQFSITNEKELQRHSVPECKNSRQPGTTTADSSGASSNATSTGSLHDIRTGSHAMETSLSENVSGRNLSNNNSNSGPNNGDINRIIPNELHNGNTLSSNSETPRTRANDSRICSETSGACSKPKVPIGARRTKSGGALDYVKRKEARPNSTDGCPNMDSTGRPRVNSYGHTARANVINKRSQQGSNSPRRDRDEYTATLNDIDWSNRPGSSRYVPKPRQHIRRTPSVNERHITNNARTVPSRSPPSAVSEQPEDSPHNSGSMPDFNRPTRNGRMWQSLSSSLSALGGTNVIEPPLTSTYM